MKVQDVRIGCDYAYRSWSRSDPCRVRADAIDGAKITLYDYDRDRVFNGTARQLISLWKDLADEQARREAELEKRRERRNTANRAVQAVAAGYKADLKELLGLEPGTDFKVEYPKPNGKVAPRFCIEWEAMQLLMNQLHASTQQSPSGGELNDLFGDED